MRKVENDAEHMLWREIRDRRLSGYKFVRQFPIGPYFADFACRERQLVVEVDGSQHAESRRDEIRNRFMMANGWSVLRFWNVDVLKERTAVLETILAVVEGRLAEQVIAPDLKFFPAEFVGRHGPSSACQHLLPASGEKTCFMNIDAFWKHVERSD